LNSPGHNLALLRDALKKNNITAYIIPVAEPHFGEDIPDHWKIVKWLTGFDGSAGVVVVTDSFAGLWTDSRYYLQAASQLAGSGFRLMKPGPGMPNDHISWLEENLVSGSRTGLDGRLFSISAVRKLEAKLLPKKISIKYNCVLIDEVRKDPPPLPESTAFDHPVKYSGKERGLKIKEVRDEMRRMKIDYHLLSSCDDIMWMLNIRGKDYPFSPLFMSYSLIDEKQVNLFADIKKIPQVLASELEQYDVVIRSYDNCRDYLSSLAEGTVILLDPARTTASLFFSIEGKLKIAEGISIPTRLKAVKNKTEIANIGKVMVKDGIVLTRLFYWVEANLGVLSLNERSVKDKLLKLKTLQEEFLGPSFETIAAFNENASLPHYRETSESNAPINSDGILLIDSGGHYMGGTTDITRTVSIGVPTMQQKADFTLVLKGHISLAMAKFPAGTKGYQLDILARKALWENGLNYGHGTGHGVGYCLNVHEGPQNISPAANQTEITPGMLISNEPAIYREGEYGIRTENLMICYEDEETEFETFLRFDTVSLCYIDKSLIERSLLNPREIEWLNSYHTEVYEKISPNLTEAEKLWLKRKTEPL